MSSPTTSVPTTSVMCPDNNNLLFKLFYKILEAAMRGTLTDDQFQDFVTFVNTCYKQDLETIKFDKRPTGDRKDVERFVHGFIGVTQRVLNVMKQLYSVIWDCEKNCSITPDDETEIDRLLREALTYYCLEGESSLPRDMSDDSSIKYDKEIKEKVLSVVSHMKMFSVDHGLVDYLSVACMESSLWEFIESVIRKQMLSQLASSLDIGGEVAPAFWGCANEALPMFLAVEFQRTSQLQSDRQDKWVRLSERCIESYGWYCWQSLELMQYLDTELTIAGRDPVHNSKYTDMYVSSWTCPKCKECDGGHKDSCEDF
jgi:hypothetical protein